MARSRSPIKTQGDAPIIRAPKPLRSIGRDSARYYCERCGRKRSVCRCEDAER